MALPALLEEGLAAQLCRTRPVFAGRCQPCTLYVSTEGKPLSFIGQKDGLCSTCGAGGTQCQTRCYTDFLQKFLREGTVYVTHSQRFLLHPSPLGHQCYLRAVQCPNTVCPLHFSLASLCVLKFLCIYSTFGCAGSLLSHRLFLWLWSPSFPLQWLLVKHGL